MIVPDHPDLSIGQRCKLLSIARSSFYDTPKGESEQNLGLMRGIEEPFPETPFFGVRQMTWHLRNDGRLMNETRIRRQMRLMGLMPINQTPTPAGQTRATRPIHICGEGCGWNVRTRSGARISPTCPCGAGSSTSWRSRAGTPARSSPGGSRTRWRPTSAPLGRFALQIACRAMDNIFIERLWRTLTYECVYLHAWETGSETKAAIRKWMTFYNHQRPHSALGGKPPALVYWQRNVINQPDQQGQRLA